MKLVKSGSWIKTNSKTNRVNFFRPVSIISTEYVFNSILELVETLLVLTRAIIRAIVNTVKLR